MSAWTPDDPGAGDPDALEDLVLGLAHHLDTLTEVGQQIGAVAQRTEATWTGQSADAWRASVTARQAQLTALESQERRGAEAVNTYLHTLYSIRTRAQNSREDLADAQRALQRAEDAWHAIQRQDDPDQDDRRLALLAVQRWEQDVLDQRAALDRLACERQSLDDAVITALQADVSPLWSGAGRLTSTAPVDLLARSTPAMAEWVQTLPDGAAGDAAARWLAEQLTAEQFEALLAASPRLAIRLMRTDTTGAFAARYPQLVAAMRIRDTDQRIAAIVAATAGLDAAELAMLSRLYPGLVGNLDGMPLQTRIDANRIAVVAARTEADDRIAALLELIEAGEGNHQTSALRERAELLTELSAVQVSRAWYDGLLTEEVQSIDAEGVGTTMTGHLVVLFDPATGQFGELVGHAGAPNVAVLLGGTGTEVSNMDKQRARAWDLVTDNGKSLAVITYLGGPMPPELYQAPLSIYATCIAPKLASFANGVRAVTGATITVAGHSYGGSVVGAAETRGMVVDRIVHIESAGAGPGVSSVQDYAAPDTPRYSMTAPGDFIELTQGKNGGILGHGADPDRLAGITRLETGRTDRTDPSSPILEGFTSHSQVFNTETDAWKNIEQVMTGGQVSLWTDRRDAVALGLMDPQYEHPMQDPDFTPATREVP